MAKTELIYSEAFSPHTRDVLLGKVSAQMSAKRFAHVLRVEEMALELCELYKGDPEKVSIAALTHDYAKERSDDEMIQVIKDNQLSDELIPFGNAIWHGVAGAELVRAELGITDEDILNAIRYHTTGAKEMSLLSKIIYVADYVERGRDFPVVAEARKIALSDLDEAVAFETKQTLLYLVKQEALIYPKTLETYNHWVVK